MEQAELTEFLDELMQSHGLATERHQDWVAPNGVLPAIGATWYPGEDPARPGILAVRVALEDDRILDELFAGLDSGESGCRDALNTFVSGTFHVMLSALWLPGHAHGVTVEDWPVGDRTWRANIGSIVTRRGADQDIPYPAAAFDAAEAAIRAEPLGPGPHWYRLFYCNLGNGETVVEALLDNEPWPAGEEAFGNADWGKSDQYYSVRNFTILVDQPRG